MKNKKIKLIYISGIGRSGTTLMDLIVSSCPQVFSVGEIFKFDSMMKSNAGCSCGKTVSNCGFWKNIKKKYASDDTNIIDRYNVRDYLKAAFFLFFSSKKKCFFSKTSDNREIFAVIKRSCGKNIKYILDSSKDAVRLIDLVQDGSFDVYNISVFRDGRAVANSFNQRTQGKGKSYFVSLLKWIFVNTILERALKKLKIRSLKISYDNFCKDPRPYIKKIEKFLDIRIPADYLSKLRTMDYHALGVNRLARKTNRAGITGIRYDDSWKTMKGPFTKIAATAIAYIFNKKWVYGKDS